MNPVVLPSAMDKLLGRLGSLTFVWQLTNEKENTAVNPVELYLFVLVNYKSTCVVYLMPNPFSYK